MNKKEDRLQRGEGESKSKESMLWAILTYILAAIFFTAQHGILTLFVNNKPLGIFLCIFSWVIFGFIISILDYIPSEKIRG